MDMSVSSSSNSSSLRPPKLDRFDRAILQGVWAIDRKRSNILTYRQAFMTPVSCFLDRIKQEEYPHTYEDKLFNQGEQQGGYYYISYLFTSGQYLEDLATEFPDRTIVYELRSIDWCSFNYCLVRPFDRKWSREQLLEQGVIEV